MTRGRFIDRQRKGVGVGEEETYFSFSRSALEKNEKKTNTTSVYRLDSLLLIKVVNL